MRAGLYVRISSDPEGRRLGVDRQRDDCAVLASERGWKVSEFSDNDLSAYSGRRRPAWERMLTDLREGRIQSVIAWANDRLYRRVRDQLDLMEAVRDAGGFIVTVKDGEVDPSSATGKMAAGIVAQVSEFESARKAERIARKHLELAQQGRWQGSNGRPFGYDTRNGKTRRGVPTGNPKPITLVPNRREARAIRGAATQVLAGTSNVSRTALEWNRSGILTPGGHRWTPGGVRRTLMSPYLAAIRIHRGVRYQGEWKPVLSEEEHQLLRARLNNHHKPETSPRRYPLTGLLECSECGSKLIGSGGAYRCQPRNGGCNKVRIDVERLDALIYFAILRWEHEQRLLRRKHEGSQKPSRDVQERQVETETKEALFRLRELQERLEALATDVADGILNRDTGYAAIEKVKDKISKVEARLASELPPPRVSFWDRPNQRRLRRWDVFESGELGPRRTYDEVQADHEWISQHFSRIVVRPARRNGRYPRDYEKAQAMILERINPFDLSGKRVEIPISPVPEPDPEDEEP